MRCFKAITGQNFCQRSNSIRYTYNFYVYNMYNFFLPQLKMIPVVECSQKQAGVTRGTQSPCSISCCPLGPRKWVLLNDLVRLYLVTILVPGLKHPEVVSSSHCILNWVVSEFRLGPSKIFFSCIA